MNHYEKEERTYSKNYRKRVAKEGAIRIVRNTLKHFKYRVTAVKRIRFEHEAKPDKFVSVVFYGILDNGAADWEEGTLWLSHKPSIGLIAHEIAHLLTCEFSGEDLPPHGKVFREWNERTQNWCQRYLRSK